MVRMRSRRFLILGALALAPASSAHSEALTVVGFNVESGGADPHTIATQIGAVQGADIWGLVEVENEDDAERFERGAEEGENAQFAHILGKSGGEDRLAIVYNETRFELVTSQEIGSLNPDNRVRAPLVAQLKSKKTGLELLFMVNHLYRGSDSGRRQQSDGLNRWGRRQKLPAIAVGDYNFDWDVQYGERRHDVGYDLMTAHHVWTWIRPERLVKSQCSKYDSILDFVFVTPGAAEWGGKSEILSPGADYCRDRGRNSDHRPVVARFEIPSASR